MAKILYGVSPIGLGHAVRAVAVGEELRRRGAETTFATGGCAAQFIGSYGFRAEDVIREPVPKVVSGEMKDAWMWYVKYWMGYRRSRKNMAAMIKSMGPDLVVGDEEFSCLALATELGMKNAMISDELELGFARSWLARLIEVRVERWYRNLQRDVDLLIVPEDGDDAGNVRHVGPVVRGVTKTREKVLAEFSLPMTGRMVLLSLSGAGISDHLVGPAVEAVGRLEDTYLVIAGNRGRRFVGDRVHDLGVVRDNQNLVAAADLVISAAGKSTIDEAASAGTPIIAIPFRNHAEQERNAAALGLGPEDMLRLPALLRERVGRRTEPRRCDGARRTADLLLGARR